MGRDRNEAMKDAFETLLAAHERALVCVSEFLSSPGTSVWFLIGAPHFTMPGFLVQRSTFN